MHPSHLLNGYTASELVFIIKIKLSGINLKYKVVAYTTWHQCELCLWFNQNPPMNSLSTTVHGSLLANLLRCSPLPHWWCQVNFTNKNSPTALKTQNDDFTWFLWADWLEMFSDTGVTHKASLNHHQWMVLDKRIVHSLVNNELCEI